MTDPYQPPLSTPDPDRTRPDFRVIAEDRKMTFFMLGCGAVQIASGIISLSFRFGWPPLLLISSGFLGSLSPFLAPLLLARRLKSQLLVLSGEALRAGYAVLKEPSRSHRGILFLTPSELVFIRNTSPDTEARRETRYPLAWILDSLDGSGFLNSRLRFLDSASYPVRLDVHDSRTWQKAITAAAS